MDAALGADSIANVLAAAKPAAKPYAKKRPYAEVNDAATFVTPDLANVINAMEDGKGFWRKPPHAGRSPWVACAAIKP